MTQSEKSLLMETLVAMGEIYGKSMTEAGVKMIANDLSCMSLEKCIYALEKCRKELRTFPTIADILKYANESDGRPGPEEAWAMVPKNEFDSVVWTDEMRDAFFICYNMIETDEVAARMAFREAYIKRVQEARDAGRNANWTATLGHYPESRRVVIEEAVRLGRLGFTEAQKLLPGLNVTVNAGMKKLVNNVIKSPQGDM